MSAQANQQLVREYFRAPDASYFAEDGQLHDTSQPHALRGRDAIGTFLRMFVPEALPGGAYDLHNVLADERRAVAEWTFRGTHSGPAMEVAPTGRRVEFSGVSVYEIQEGRFVRARIYYDTGTFADQLGFVGDRLPRRERRRWAEWWEKQL